MTLTPDEPVRTLSGKPDGPVHVPASLARLAGDEQLEPVWVNELGGLTFRAGERYLKWAPTDLEPEAARLRWASAWTAVPEVLEHGFDDEGSWLVTRAIPARSAVDPRWVAEPAVAAREIGAGLRAMHDALPVDGCPFDWGVASRVARAGSSASLVEDAPPVDVLVVCHGDACAPNTLLADDGTWAAHVDLGTLGTADRWADLAIAAWSAEWNYGPGFAPLVYDAYGIEPDAERIAYYRRLWDAT